MDFSSSSLRQTLLRTDLTPPRIQKSAAAMLSHYDRVPSVAVDEWRQCLATCEGPTLLPLLYVCNEVIQTSKRNRGNKFLEAFSPVLSSSLRVVCGRDRTLVEKIRRVVKIWGDRRIYSARFVSEVLQGMEPFRQGNSGGSAATTTTTAKTTSPARNGAASAGYSKPSSALLGSSTVVNGGGGDVDDLLSGAPTDFSSVTSPKSSLILNIDVPVGDRKDAGAPGTDGASGAHVSGSMSSLRPGGGSGMKRRRQNSKSGHHGSGSGGKGGGGIDGSKGTGGDSTSSPEAKKKRTLHMALEDVDGWRNQYQMAKSILGGLSAEEFTTDGVEDMVGDELGQNYSRVVKAEKTLLRHRSKLHAIASNLHSSEHEIHRRLLPSLKSTVERDRVELKHCQEMEEALILLRMVHGVAKEARDTRRAEEEERKLAEETERKKKLEEEESRRELERTLNSKREAAPGMIWNPATKEYQNIHDQTDESWRD